MALAADIALDSLRALMIAAPRVWTVYCRKIKSYKVQSKQEVNKGRK